MVHRIAWFVSLISAGLAGAGPVFGQYRGMAPGWPQQAGSYHSAHYPAGNGPAAYYVARPVAGQYGPAGYVPVTAAYANPAYFGSYRMAPTQYPRAAYYAPQATTAYYAPTRAAYALSNSYAVSPAGGSTAGAEAYYGYGQPAPLNYVPPRFSYRTTYAQVPVYAYRPVTVYDPITAQPVTCLQPSTTTQCQPQRSRWFSWFNHSWFRKSCGSGGCGPAPTPTTAYCTSGYCGPQPACGQQPYYPTQPQVIIPTVPAPGGIITQPLPGYAIPPAGPTVPSPPTRFPGTAPGTGVPANTRPSLGPPPGGAFTPIPSNPLPGTPAPGGSFSPGPGGAFTPNPGTGITPVPGGGFGSSFPTDNNYPPVSDPYSGANRISPNFGSVAPAAVRAPQTTRSMTGSTPQPPPAAGSTLQPGITTVPDPAANQPLRPINRAPQLLDPRDKTAAAGSIRWAVVPAVWPTKAKPHAASPYRVYQERSYDAPRADVRHAPAAATQRANPADYDDRGWKSARR
ncbi:MAG: hypothetical protein WD872_18430 [Pirellulaceae bacterium]